MFFSLRKYMLQLFICVVLEEKHNILRAHSIKNGKIVQTYEKSFEERERLFDYIQILSKDFQLFYISVFFNSTAQGVVPSLDIKDFAKFGVNAKNVQSISVNNARVYAAKNALSEFMSLFKDCGGLDLIYSPLILLYYHINLAKLDENKITLCIYRHISCVGVMILKGKQILFGSFFDISPEENKDLGDDESNLKDENYDFQGLEKMLNEKLDGLNDESTYKANLNDFANDMNMCRYVFSSVQEYYNNPLYKGQFIDELVIFDTENISDAVLDYIEGEIFLKPRVIKVDTLDSMHDLMKKELKA